MEGTERERSIQKGTRAAGRLSGATIALIAIVILAAVGGIAYVAWPRGTSPPSVEYVKVDGSSTVYPITSAWAEDFNTPAKQVTVAFSGTGGGFGKFCRGETDLSDASRPIRQSEMDVCTGAAITGIVEFLVAYDGLSVVVNKNNAFAQNLTVKELCRIFTSNTSVSACGGAGPHATNWRDLNATWPAQPIECYSPGTDSGTFDYFEEVILTPFTTAFRPDCFLSEDDNILVQGIANEPYSIGYFGYAYYAENTDLLKVLGIDDGNDANGAGPIVPSETTIKDGTYRPLSRPLFIYGHTTAPAAFQQSLQRDVVKEFLTFGYSTAGQTLLSATGYVGLTPSEIATQVAKIPA